MILSSTENDKNTNKDNKEKPKAIEAAEELKKNSVNQNNLT